MKIISTGNNFGAGVVEPNSFQNEKLVVLNSKFTFSNKSEAYQTASVLELYVPELSIPKSGISGAYIMFSAEDKFFGTTVKTWIKNSKTVCIEKLDLWPEQTDEYTIYLLSLYVPKGQRGVFEVGAEVNLTLNNTTSTNNYGYYKTCFVEDGWCLIGLMTGSYNTQSKPSDDIVELGGFPTDVDIELPFVADNINSIQTYGVDMLQATIKDAVLTVKNIPWGWGGYPKDNFLYAACVRNKE